MKLFITLIISCLSSLICLYQHKKIDTTDEDNIVCVYTNTASFPGGISAMKRFFEKNINYSKKEKSEGTVFIKFMVDIDGSLSQFSVAKSLSKKLDDESLRVARLMPKWIPAIEGGTFKKIWMNIPISFKL